MSLPDTVLRSRSEAVLILTLNRPDRRNAVNDALRESLLAELSAAQADETVRAVVVTGAGTAFCSGGDIRGMRARLEMDPALVAEVGWHRQRATHALVKLLHDLPKPTVAAVNGPATGLGADLAMSCDFVVSSPEASIAFNYVLRGLVPDGGAGYFLPRRVGLSRAKELVFSGRTVAAEEGLRLGLVDLIAPPGQILEEAATFAARMGEHSSTAVALAKGFLNRSLEDDIDAVLRASGEAQAICYTTAAHRRSVEAFLARSAK